MARPEQAGGRQQKAGRKKRVKKAELEDEEAKRLEAEIESGKPACGTNPLAITGDVASAGWAAARLFTELPLSRSTLEGLNQNRFETLTTIQRAALPHALAGRDILGAAKTGSGKTLAFLIPLVEHLFRARWTRLDGLGGLVLTPTRELALQIFQELRKVGAHHDLSAGLLIGGKNVKEEQASVNRMNILVATPGRLLQHMDETPGFDASNLRVLVLDEADRLLDMGFAATLDAILGALPRSRQTMLFSATQTKSVKDLARLSLQDPEYLAVHEASDTATPLKLQQAVAVVAAEHKVDTLWSFIKTHLAAKTIIFLSTCKQVRFMHEAFKKLRPGVPLRALHGGMKQMKRMVVFQEFCQAQHMVLFATDVAGRGLDFPSVDWVVQADCPEDAAAYIHRVGRTARYMSAGRALLLLTPGEADGMRAALAAAKIPVKAIKINPAKQQPVGPALQALLSKNTQLKEWGQRALVAYVRSVFLAPAKDVFKVDSLDLEAIAASWGLAAAPRMRFLRRVGSQRQVVAQLGDDDGADDADADDGRAATALDAAGRQQRATRAGKAAAPAEASGSEQEEGQEEDSSSDDDEGRQQTGKQAAATGRRPGSGEDDGGGGGDDDDDFLVVKRRNVFSADDGGEEEEAAPAAGATAQGQDSKSAKKKRLKIKVGKASGQRVVFDEAGQALDPLAALAADPQLANGPADEQAGGEEGGEGVYVVAAQPEDRFTIAAQVMKKRDAADKARQRELRAAAKAERKARRKAALAAEQDERDGIDTVRLGGPHAGGSSSDDDHMEEDSGGSQGSGSDSDAGAENASMSGSSDDEQEHTGSGRSRPEEVAHAGMQRLSGAKRPHAAAAQGERAGRGDGGQGRKKAKPGPAQGLSLAEQEALVLARIAAARS